MPQEEYSLSEVLRESEAWCAKHPGWKRFSDIPNTDACFKTWEELSAGVRRSRPCKYPIGYVSGAGVFYRDVLQVPRFHNFMNSRLA